MNLRTLVSPGLYGGGAAVVVAAAGYALAAWQSVSLLAPAFVYVLGGLTAFGLLAGTSSLNENSATPEPTVDRDDLLAAPTEAGRPRRLLLVCFCLGLVLAGGAGVALFG